MEAHGKGRPSHAARDDLDLYLRADHTALARALRLVSPSIGRRYTSSCHRRALDLVVGLPAAAVGLPIAVLLAAINRAMAPRLAPWFVQHRVGQRGTQRIVKLRSMVPRLEGSVAPLYLHEAARVTPLGRVMRRYDLDELPQLLDVLEGRLSLVGIRVLPVPVYEHLRDTWPTQRFARWEEAYRCSRLGLTGVHQLFRGAGKADLQRYHRDLFYDRHASLGFDLYLLWLTGWRLARRVKRRRKGHIGPSCM
jgi:lipopolysaccharide/colanic/teichoic acid biosynthesis glycosyltransferase